MKKKLWIGIALVLTMVLVMAGVDVWTVSRFEKPIFAWPAQTEDDGGSGLYQGLGYTVELRGNFLPEDELPGVTYYEIRCLGQLVLAGIRD